MHQSRTPFVSKLSSLLIAAAVGFSSFAPASAQAGIMKKGVVLGAAAALVGTAMAKTKGDAGANVALPSSRSGFQSCPQFFPSSVTPRPVDGEQLKLRELCFDAFAVLHSGSRKTPVYVFERLNREQLLDAKDEERTNQFFADARLPMAERAQLDDYKGSGMDRGHMAPAADMPSAAAMAQSFSLANMVPQDPNHNRKVWSVVEKSVRSYALRAKGDVYVVTGPAYKSNAGRAGGVAIPSHLFKLVYDPTEKRAWAYWHENSASARMDRPISYQELVALVGYELLPGMEVLGGVR